MTAAITTEASRPKTASAGAAAKRRRAEQLPFYVAGAVLLAAYLAICLHTRTPWPWGRVVHEDGRRTLWQTIFYFEHAVRELPLDLLLGEAVAGGMVFFYPAARLGGSAGLRQRTSLLRHFGALALVVLASIVGGALWTGGGRVLLDNLGQMHTRSGAPLAWGAHWRYHFLERLATIYLAFCAVGLHWMSAGLPRQGGARGRFMPFGLTLGSFVALSVLFRLSGEPFREPTFLGHEARELFTHALVTLPLALGTCFWLRRQVAARGIAASPGRLRWPVYFTGALAVSLGAYLAAGVWLTGAAARGQSRDLVTLICPHFFEHSFTYLVVPLAAGLGYLWLVRGPRQPRSRVVG
jgi:hypothetical protein